MNFKSIVAFLMAASVFGFGAFTATNNPYAFLDFHAALIVFGGTIAVAAISFQIDRIWLMLKVFYMRVVRGQKYNYVAIIRELMIISDAYRTNDPNLPAIVKRSSDHFMQEAMGILMDDFLEPEEMAHI